MNPAIPPDPSALVEPCDLYSLATTPLWQTLLIDRPWIGAFLVAAIAIIAAVFINRSGHPKRAAIVAGIGLLAAGAVAMLGSLITTPEAMLRERTERFVNAIAGADPDTLETMLAPRFVVASQGVPGLDLGSDWLLSVTAGMDRAIRSNSVTITGVEMQGSNAAKVEFRCRTSLVEESQTVGSTWEIQWQRFQGQGPDAWQAVRLEAMTILSREPGRLWIDWGSRHRVR